MSNSRQPPGSLQSWNNPATVAAAAALSSQPPVFSYVYQGGAQRLMSRPPLSSVAFGELSSYTFPASDGVSVVATRQVKEQKPSETTRPSSLSTPMQEEIPNHAPICPQHNHYHQQQSLPNEQYQQHLQDQQSEDRLQNPQHSEQEEQIQEQQQTQEQQLEEAGHPQEQSLDERQRQEHQKIHQLQIQHLHHQNLSSAITLPEVPKKVPARRVWSHTETKCFLNTMHKYYQSIQNASTNNQKGELWDRIVEEHNRHYPERSKRSCQQQWERLYCRYKSTKRHNSQPGVTPVLFEYNEEIKVIIGDNPRHPLSFDENSVSVSFGDRASTSSSSSSTITNYEQSPSTIVTDRASLERVQLNRPSTITHVTSMPPVSLESSYIGYNSTNPSAQSFDHSLQDQNINMNGTITLERAAAETILLMDDGSSVHATGTLDQRKKIKPINNVDRLLELLEKQHQEDQERKREEQQKWEEYQRRTEEFRQDLVDAFNGLVDVLKEIHSDFKKE